MTDRTGERYALVIVFCFLLLLVIGDHPFSGGGNGIGINVAGDILREIELASLSLLSLPAFILLRKQSWQIVSNSLSVVLLMAWAAASLLWSNVPDIAFRHFMGTTLAALLTLLTASLSPRRLVNVLLAVTGIVMLTDFAGLLLVPHLSIDHGGLWVGLHSQKNIAGYTAALATLLWLLIGRARGSSVLVCGSIAWGIFCYFTWSKTSLILLAIMVPTGLALSGGLNRGFNRKMVVLLGVVLVVFIPLVIATLSILPLSFTGRTRIWQFVIFEAIKTPIFGVGYDSFWEIGPLAPPILYGSPFVAQITHAHNGYLDTLLSLGVVGLLLALITILRPYRILWRYRVHDDADVRQMLLSALVLLTFGILHNCLESSLLQGMVLIWTLMLLSIWVINANM